MAKEEIKTDIAPLFYKKMPLSRYFIKEAYIEGKAIYYKGFDDKWRIIYGH